MKKYIVITSFYREKECKMIDSLIGEKTYFFRKPRNVDTRELISYLNKDINNHVIFLYGAKKARETMKEYKRVYYIKNQKLIDYKGDK